FAEAVAPGAGAARRKDYQCALIYAAYQQFLVHHRLYDLEGRFWYARDLLARGHRRPFEGVRALFVAGFTAFTHSQAGILELFRPVKSVMRAADATGVTCLEAPGLVGEVRLVARQIKTLLLEGTRPDDILVSMRDVLPYADLVREVFAEYDIPVDVEGTEPL